MSKSTWASTVAVAVTATALIATGLELHSSSSRDSGGAADLAATGGGPGGRNQSASTDQGRLSSTPPGAPNATGRNDNVATATPGTASPPPSACGAGSVSFQLTTDKPTYHSGETVLVTLTAAYRGPSRCAYGGGCIPFVIVEDASKRSIATTMTPPNCGRTAPITLKDGTLLNEQYPWNQQPLNAQGTATTGSELPRGTYTLIADWHALGQSAPITVQLIL